jgi:hypothetical protein
MSFAPFSRAGTSYRELRAATNNGFPLSALQRNFWRIAFERSMQFRRVWIDVVRADASR